VGKYVAFVDNKSNTMSCITVGSNMGVFILDSNVDLDL
jgi:hypothetical protein